jgi:hypothetical protein
MVCSTPLAEITALLAQRLSICSVFAMLSFDAFTIRAVIVVVIYLPMFGRVLRGMAAPSILLKI